MYFMGITECIDKLDIDRRYVANCTIKIDVGKTKMCQLNYTIPVQLKLKACS